LLNFKEQKTMIRVNLNHNYFTQKTTINNRRSTILISHKEPILRRQLPFSKAEFSTIILF